jgi:hypothetical protein
MVPATLPMNAYDFDQARTDVLEMIARRDADSVRSQP